MIKVHDILVPQNNTFPVAETNDVRGSVKVFETVAERDAINSAYLLPGTLCYIKEDDVYYKYYVGPRSFVFDLYGLDMSSFSQNNNENYAHLNALIRVVANDKLIFRNSEFTYSITSRSQGSIKANISNDSYTFTRAYNDIMIIASLTDPGSMKTRLYEAAQNVSMTGPSAIINEWININFSNIYVGDTAPQYLDTVWVDTGNGKNPEIPTPLDEHQQMVLDIAGLKDAVTKLSLIMTSGARAGDSTIGNNPYATLDDFTGLTPGNTPYTVSNISIKCDTYANLNANKRNLINGEPVYATDTQTLYILYNNILLSLVGGGTFSAGNIMEMKGSKSLRSASVDLLEKPIEEKSDIATINKSLRIISAFACKDENLDAAATHNFIELGNYSDAVISLDGLFIVYKDGDKVFHEQLNGYIEPNSTYIIRANRCSYASNITLDIDEYDYDWNISFNEEGSEFYLVHSPNNITKKVTAKGKVGYIDKFAVSGFTNIYYKKHSLNFDYVNDDEITYINVSKLNNKLYYEFADMLRIKPRHNKDIISKLDPSKPNCINDTFGEQGTVSITNKAEKFITWVSVGCYDEYVILEHINGQKQKLASTVDKWVFDNNIVTTHRAWLNNLDEGVYTYYIYRDEKYKSNQKCFRIYSDDEIDQEHMNIGVCSNFVNNNFSDIIKKQFIQNLIGSHFTVNTAGATTDDEISQWIDYVNASIYTDIPIRSKKDSIDNLNKFYTFNKPFELDYKKVDDVYGFTYGNYYIIIIGNNDVDKDELNKWINSIDKFTIVFTERKDITAGNAIYNHIVEKEYKVITSTYKESAFDVEDDIYEKTISIENYFTDNVFNENLI